MQDYSGYGGPPAGGYGYGGTTPMPPMPPRPPRGRVGMLSYLLVALAAGALGAGTVVALYHPASSTSATPQASSSAPAAPPSSAAPAQGAAPGTGSGEQAIVNNVEPGTVVIDTNLQYSNEAAAGTGMVISSGGLVLTNNHVIEDSTSIKATDIGNGKTYPAKVLGYDVTGDVALIQLQGASGLRTIPVGNSGAVRTGAAVVAMGNAEGQDAIIPAAGQVTGLNQTITASDEGGSVTTETLHGMIETNANIVSGDSGGPLADSAGQVIGMDTAGNDVSFTQQSAAGFAIPINTALSIVRQIEAGDASSAVTIGYPPFMGIFIATTSDSSPADQAEQQGGGFGGFGGFGGNGSQSCYANNRDVPAPSDIAQVSSGTLVLGTICGGPAATAGITAGSVITAVNGQAIGAPNDLTAVVSGKYRPGEAISVTWVSPSGRRTTSKVALTAGPPQ